MQKLWELSATELADAYRIRETTPRDVVVSILERINEIDAQIGAFTAVDGNNALASADVALRRIENGEAGRLCGVPVAIKELFAVNGLPWTGQSFVRDGVVAAEDAALVQQLRRAGAIIIGTTRTHELAWGITTQHEKLGGTKNPWNRSFTPGGSSGGSGAAVATGMAAIALGSDTGGSVRIPAAFCGVVGYKPSRDAVDASGLLPHAPRFDHPGWLGRTVDDVVLLHELFTGQSISTPDLSDLSQLRVGVVNFQGQSIGSDQLDAYLSLLASVEEQGAQLVTVEWPRGDVVFETFRDLQAVDALATHRNVYRTWPVQPDLYGSDVRSRLEYAETVTASMVHAAEAQLDELAGIWSEALAAVDVMLIPVSASGPSTIVDPDWTTINGERAALRDTTIGFCASANMIGAPSCSIPVGRDSAGIPIGIQVLDARGEDATVLGAARLLADGNAVPLDELWASLPVFHQDAGTS